VSPVADRPYDAYAAYHYLDSQSFVTDSIGLLGWSAGGSSAMATMVYTASVQADYKAAVIFYAGCGWIAISRSSVLPSSGDAARAAPSQGRIGAGARAARQGVALPPRQDWPRGDDYRNYDSHQVEQCTSAKGKAQRRERLIC